MLLKMFETMSEVEKTEFLSEAVNHIRIILDNEIGTRIAVNRIQDIVQNPDNNAYFGDPLGGSLIMKTVADTLEREVAKFNDSR